ncbi:MAG: hypothetical protein LLG00_04580 [Planctomycetaceae bacterium]|nr:hypothetical protein [Planctomycetaceae bacterium]
MRYSLVLSALPVLLLLPGCASETHVDKPSYSGKVEVLRDGKPALVRDYAFGLRDSDVAPLRVRAFRVVDKGTKVAVLRVYWPTLGLEKQLSVGIEKQKMDDLAKKVADAAEKGTGKRVKAHMSLALTITSDYPLVSRGDGHYSLMQRGSDDAEHYGYIADSDDDAVEIALNYLARFVVPMETGTRMYELGTLRTGNRSGARGAVGDK